jgi:nucleotide-binding universal stress UspA family protein
VVNQFSINLQKISMKSILVPIDLSDSMPLVLDQARQIAQAFAAAIHLVHVKEITPVTPPTTFGYGVAGMPELMPMSTAPVLDQVAPPLAGEESQRAKLANWQKEIRQAGVNVSLDEPTGAVVEEILRIADAFKSDLIVMGRHGHGAMYNLLVGSVTEGVLKRGSCPVLLVPSPRP